MAGGLPAWADLIAGKGCPFCAPRPDVNEHSFKVADLSVSTLYLEREQTYRGYCVMVFRKRHVTGIEHLTPDEYAAFTQDLKRAAEAVFKTVQPDHMNYATLGNAIPHLHCHVIPRYKNDPRWGGPVWMTNTKDMPRVLLESDAAYLQLAAEIRAAL